MGPHRAASARKPACSESQPSHLREGILFAAQHTPVAASASGGLSKAQLKRDEEGSAVVQRVGDLAELGR